jgi:hypothetical protein
VCSWYLQWVMLLIMLMTLKGACHVQHTLTFTH